MFLLDDVLVLSPSDMSAATSCEYAFVRRLDVKLGWAEPLETKADPMLDRAAQLGDAHEHRVLEVYRRRFGVHTPGTPGGVADIPVLGVAPEELAAAQAQTVAALRDGADVVFQGAFFDGRLHGLAQLGGFLRLVEPTAVNELPPLLELRDGP